METCLPPCSVCGREAAFQDPNSADQAWYCIDHTPKIWSPEVALEAGADQIGRRAKILAFYIRVHGKLPTLREELNVTRLPQLESASQVKLTPELEKIARRYERAAESIEHG